MLSRVALDSANRTTLEISEGGLVMYPVTIGDTLFKKTNTICNDGNTKGNGAAMQQGFDLKGIGGICNWVPTW